MGARLRWASATIWTMRASTVSLPTRSAFMRKRAGGIHGAADDLATFLAADGHRLTRHHGFINGGAALADHAIDGDLLAGADAQNVTCRDVGEIDILLAAVGADAACGLGCKAEQGLDGARGLVAGPQFQHLAQQHQHGDNGGGFEIDRDRTIMLAEGGREDLRCQRGDDAVNPGDAGAECNQREHVEVAGFQRIPSPAQRTASPPRGRPVWPGPTAPNWKAVGPAKVHAGEMAAHFEQENRKCQREAKPEAARHVDQFVVGAAVGRHHHGFKRHATNRAGAGADLTDLRMHGAGVLSVLRRGIGGGLDLFWIKVTGGIGHEFGAAVGAAEMIAGASMIRMVGRGERVHRHAADGVDGGGFRAGRRGVHVFHAHFI